MSHLDNIIFWDIEHLNFEHQYLKNLYYPNGSSKPLHIIHFWIPLIEAVILVYMSMLKEIFRGGSISQNWRFFSTLSMNISKTWPDWDKWWPDLESAIQNESKLIIKPFVTKPLLACVIIHVCISTVQDQ